MRGRIDIVIFVVAFLVSLIGHFVLLEGLSAAARKWPQRHYRTMEVAVFKPPPPPVEEKKPEKKEIPKLPPPEPIDIPEPFEDTSPPPNTEEAEVPEEEAKPVFGISMSSVVGPGTGSGFSVRVGNTLMKDPDEKFTPPDQIKTYAAKPVALHKVNKMPKRIGICKSDYYPPEAQAMGVEGRVRLRVEIRADGTVGKVTVLEGLGYGLDEAAVAEVKKCRFEPAVMGGRPVPTRINYTYTFIIED